MMKLETIDRALIIAQKVIVVAMIATAGLICHRLNVVVGITAYLAAAIVAVLFFLFFFSIAGEWLHVVNAPAVADEPSAYTLERTMFENEFIGYAGKWTPILVLLLAPFMAFLCRILYRKHSTGYMGNFAFVLYLNSVTFISLAAYLLLYRFFPAQSILWTLIFFLYLLYYTTAASHTVYTGTGWAKCAVKSVLMWTAFLLVVASALIGLTVLIAMKMDVL